MTKPIRPAGVVEIQKRKDSIFYIFNQLILANWDGECAKVYQLEAGHRIAKTTGVTFDDVCENKYFNGICEHKYLYIENEYRQAGWSVIFHTPGLNEPHFDPYWLFRKGDTD